MNTPDVTVEIGDDFVATVEIIRGPNNYFNPTVIADIADAFERNYVLEASSAPAF